MFARMDWKRAMRHFVDSETSQAREGSAGNSAFRMLESEHSAASRSDCQVHGDVKTFDPSSSRAARAKPQSPAWTGSGPGSWHAHQDTLGAFALRLSSPSGCAPLVAITTGSLAEQAAPAASGIPSTKHKYHKSKCLLRPWRSTWSARANASTSSVPCSAQLVPGP